MVMRVVATSWPVAVIAALGRTLGVLGPFEGPVQAHQRRHRDRADQTIDRVVVGFAQAAGELRSEFLASTLTPGVSPLGVAVVLLRSWHQVVHPLSGLIPFVLSRTVRYP